MKSPQKPFFLYMMRYIMNDMIFWLERTDAVAAFCRQTNLYSSSGDFAHYDNSHFALLHYADAYNDGWQMTRLSALKAPLSLALADSVRVSAIIVSASSPHRMVE